MGDDLGKTVIQLDDEQKKIPFEEILQHARVDFIRSILKMFLLTNAFVVVLIIAVSIEEFYFISQKLISHADRSINATVIMTLIGATTVQVGTALISIVGFLFRSQTKSASTD